MTFKQASAKQWVKQAETALPSSSQQGLRVINQQLCCCCGDVGIVIFDSELQQQRTLPAADIHGHVELVIDVNVTDQSNKDVVVAASNGLYHRSKG